MQKESRHSLIEQCLELQPFTVSSYLVSSLFFLLGCPLFPWTSLPSSAEYGRGHLSLSAPGWIRPGVYLLVLVP